MMAKGLYADNPARRKKLLRVASMKPSKARKILHDGEIRGKKITAKQRRYFGFLAGGK
jgi:hypothetical protein